MERLHLKSCPWSNCKAKQSKVAHFSFHCPCDNGIVIAMRSAALLVAMLLASVPAALAAGPTEREVADWAIRMGGRVTLEGHAGELTDPAQIPAGDVRITGLDLTNTLIDPTDMRRLAGLTSLKELYLPGP